MPQRKVKDIPPDELWKEWRGDFEAIKRNIHYLFRERRTFRVVAEVFRENERLPRWAPVSGCLNSSERRATVVGR
jgi:hypothetical protein